MLNGNRRISAVAVETEGRDHWMGVFEVGGAKWCLLIGAGVLVALTTCFVHTNLRVPGSAVLRSVLPFVLASFWVPRRYTGTHVSMFAGVTFSLLAACAPTSIRLSPMAAVCLLGPSLDLASGLSKRFGMPAFWLCAIAGLVANSFGFLVRSVSGGFVVDGSMFHHLTELKATIFVSFALCGVLAGLICGLTATRK